MKLWIPALPRMPNESRGLHWSHVKRERDRFGLLVLEALQNAGTRPHYLRARATFTRVSVAREEPDRDNLAASFKPVIDGLVRVAVIPDDKPSILDATFAWERSPRRDGQGVRIEITSIDSA